MRVFAFGAVAAGGVMFLTDNLSTAIIVMAISCILIFIVHPKIKPFIAIAAGVAAVLAVAVMVMSVTLVNSDNFRLRRILTWLDRSGVSSIGMTFPEINADSICPFSSSFSFNDISFFLKNENMYVYSLSKYSDLQNRRKFLVFLPPLSVSLQSRA